MLILSEYQEGLRNARVYKTQRGEYGVIVYDAEEDREEFKTFVTEDSAEEYAEDWVLRVG
jgi:hypothetical protein